MTDNEIIKALECCTGANCIECPFNGNGSVCVDGLVRSAFDLIKRQQAEIERVTLEYAGFQAGAKQIAELTKFHPYKLHYGNLRMEIAREVADRLKAKGVTVFRGGLVVTGNDIDNLVKEMEKEV